MGCVAPVAAAMYSAKDACGPQNYPPALLGNSDVAYVSCCAQDGLSGGRQLGGACSGELTYAAAQEFCAASGMRLCSESELPVACGSGCNYDSQLNWFSSYSFYCSISPDYTSQMAVPERLFLFFFFFVCCEPYLL